MTTQYLPLAEYSSKYKVSISTLRRRIKAEDISFIFEDGKYLIQDGPVSTHQRVHRPSPRFSEATSMGAHKEISTGDFSYGAGAVIKESAPMFGMQMPQHGEPKPSVPEREKEERADEPVLAVANRLLTELKKAYSQILHEKEEQLLHLKEELLDLKTLVRVLESENDRLSRSQK